MNLLKLRIIRPDDVLFPKVWDLREEVLRKPLGLSLKNEDLSSEQNEFVVCAFKEEKLAGCLMLKATDAFTFKLRQMAVDKNFQRKGIGAKLIKAAEDFALENNIRNINLHARKTAVPFYEKCGYHTEGDQFEEVGLPHLLMKKQLS